MNELENKIETMVPFPDPNRSAFDSMRSAPRQPKAETILGESEKFIGIEDLHDVRAVLLEWGLLHEQDEFTQADAEALLIRANKTYSHLDANLALGFAFIDRKVATRPPELLTLEAIDTDVIQKLLRENGVFATEEDIKMMIMFGRSGKWSYDKGGIVDQWINARAEASNAVASGMSGVIDRGNIVSLNEGFVPDVELLKQYLSSERH